MTAPFRKFVSDGALYMCLAVLQKGFAFLTVPILTRFFSPEDYGTVMLINNASTWVTVVLGLGLDSALIMLLAESEDEEDARRIASTVLWIRFIVFGLALLMGLLFLTPVSERLVPGQGSAVPAIAAAMVSTFLMTLVGHFGQILQAQARNRTRVQAEFVITLLYVGVTLAGVLLFHLGPTAIYLPGIAVGLLVGPVYAMLTRRSIGLCFSLKAARDLLHVGLPLVPANMAAVAMTASASFFVQSEISLAAVGILNAAGSLANIVSLCFFPFAQIWTPFVHRHRQSPDARGHFVRIHALYVAGLVVVFAGIGLFAQEVAAIVLAVEYRDAFLYVPLMVAASIAYEVGGVFAIGIGIARKTYHRAWIVGLSAGIYALGLWAFVPRFGLWAVPICALFAYTVSGILSISLSNYYYPVPYRWGRYVILFAISACAIFTLYELPISLWTFLIKVFSFIFIALVAAFLLRRDHAKSVSWAG